jgi:hypothetical protein
MMYVSGLGLFFLQNLNLLALSSMMGLFIKKRVVHLHPVLLETTGVNRG